MIKRLFWLILGIAAGVFVMRKLGRAKRAVGPEGLNRAVGRATDRASHLVNVFTDSMHTRERELRSALGLDSQ